MSNSLSKKIITYDAIERYHDNLEEQLNNEYLRKNELSIENGTGENSIVQKGSNNVASGTFSAALGKDSNASGNYAFASGNSVASGKYSHAEGFSSIASGECSHAEGFSSIADGYGSHAEGEDTEASGDSSHAEGFSSIASGNASHAEGYYTEADGYGSHAEGEDTEASGICSHAEGYASEARGYGSHAEGSYTIANNESEHASGKFNVSTESSDKSEATRFSIGIGTSDTNRKNAFEVKQNGDIYVDGVEGRIQDRLNIDPLVPIVPIQYIDLKKLRDTYQLIPGQKYRIIDYITTTTQEGTSSAFHPFDVVVTALDAHTLSENASAVKSDRDGDGYFGTENVEAWQLKYCLDNDTERFAWADNSTVQWYSRIVANYIVDQSGTQTYHLDKESYIYDYETMPHPDTREDTLVFYTQNPIYFEEAGADYGDIYFYNGITTVDGVEYDSWRKFDWQGVYWVNSESDGDGLFALTERIVFNGAFVWPDRSGVENGKGVIYNMIDEYGNECPYDFKNIKFYHDGLGTDVYTFTWIDEEYNVMDTSVFGNNGTLTYYGEINGVHGNIVKPYIEMIYDEDTGDYLGTKQSLNNITFISDYEYEGYGNEGFCGCYYNSFGNDCYSNSFGNGCFSNSFGNDCAYNSFGNYCYNNTFSNNCHNNSFGNLCYNNSFGNGCYNNSFGNDCTDNSFGNDCADNSFGNDCAYNSFGNGCAYNSFRVGPSSASNLRDYCNFNKFCDGCTGVILWNSTTASSTNCLQSVNVKIGYVGMSTSITYPAEIKILRSVRPINAYYNGHTTLAVDYGEKWRHITGNVTLANDDRHIICDNTSAITITLPTGWNGAEYYIHKRCSSSISNTIKTSGSQYISYGGESSTTEQRATSTVNQSLGTSKFIWDTSAAEWIRTYMG